MQKKLTLGFLLLLLALSVFPQSNFQKLYNTGASDFGNQTVISINGIATAGSTGKVGAGGYDALLEIFDTSGVLQVQKQYGGSGTEYGTSMTAGVDGYAITGRTNSFSSNSSQDVSLIKTDWAGALQWTKAYHTDSTEYGNYIARTIDSGYIITGQTRSLGSGGWDLFLIKTDAAGHLQWSNTYGGPGDEDGLYILQTPNDSGFLAIGYTGSGGAGMLDGYAVKTDKNGAVQIQFALGGSGDEQFKSFTVCPAGLIFAGTTGSMGNDKLFLACVDKNTWQLKWAKTYGGINVDQLASVATDNRDGNIVVSGFTSSFGNSSGADGLYFKVDTSGSVVWSYAVGRTGNTGIQQIFALNDGSFCLTGYTDSFGLSGNDDVYLARTLRGGALCNNGRNVSLTVASWSPTITLPFTAATSHVGTFTETSPTFVENSYSPNTVDICSQQILNANAGSNKTICQGGSTTIGGSPTGSGGNGLRYVWSPSNSLDSATVANPTASPAGTTVYTVTVTDNASATVSAQVRVSVDTVPAITFTVQPSTVCTTKVDTLSAIPGGGTFSGAGVSGTQFTAAQAPVGLDTITYTFTDGAQCSASKYAVVTVQVCAGINEVPDAGISISPNPSNGIFELTLNNLNTTGSRINVYDLSGRIVYNGTVNPTGKTSVSLLGQPAGTYLLQFVGANQTLHYKLVIE